MNATQETFNQIVAATQRFNGNGWTVRCVGGTVRDWAMGVTPNDFDFVVSGGTFAEAVEHFSTFGRLTCEVESTFTFKVRVDGFDEDVDFVVPRKENGPWDKDGKPASVEPGTFEDDEARRDFTWNAMSIDAEGTFRDPFNGMADMEAGRMSACGNAFDRFMEDPTRAGRAMKFAARFGFTADEDMEAAFANPEFWEACAASNNNNRQNAWKQAFETDAQAAATFFASWPKGMASAFTEGCSMKFKG